MNVPNCLQNLIGVCQETTTTAPTSGYYINDLEGINLDFAAAIADSNYTTGLNLLTEKIDFATLYTVNDLSTHLLPFFRVNSTVDELRIGEFKTTYLTPGAADKGVKLKLTDSRLLKMRIDRVIVNLQQTAFAHVLTITDGQNITNYNFTTDGDGDAEIITDYLAETREVFITMDNTAINPNNTEVKRSCNCYNKNSKFVKGYGWGGSSNAMATFGLQVYATAECDENELSCIISHRLALPILYQAGVQIVKELVTTSRLNSFTILSAEKGAFMLKEFEDQYQRAIDTLAATVPDLMNRVDNICVTCNGTRYVQGRP